MAYFNHAFQKTFVGYNGFVTEPGLKTNELTLGEFTFVDPKTWDIPENLDPATTLKCPLVLVSGSIHPNDKIGPYHGGYAETVKSKTINPKYVSSFYKVESCPAQQAQVTVGANYDNYTTGRPNFGLCNANSGTVIDKEFLCGETYNLRVDIKGSPALRTLTRNSYYTAAAYTGCCPEGEIAPSAVNPLIVYVNWAYQLLNSPLINPYIQVEITYSVDAGVNWLELGDGTSSTTNLNLLLGYIQAPSTLPANATPADTLAGLLINGAYVDTRFDNCTFYPNDSIIAFLEPVKIYASEVDLNGDPCAFAGLCVYNTCDPYQLKGTGENVIRNLILTEGYMQQPFYTGSDLRIREITNGTDVYDAINRNAFYTSYYIQHNVPRFNNPTGVFDNDQYLLQIVVTEDNVVSVASRAASTSTAAAGALPAYGTIAVLSTAGLLPGMVVTLTSGTGTIAANAYVYEVVSATVFTITLGSTVAPITVPLDNTSILSATTNYNVAFEGFVEAWLNNAGSGCTTLTTYDCPETCDPIDPNANNEG